LALRCLNWCRGASLAIDGFAQAVRGARSTETQKHSREARHTAGLSVSPDSLTSG